MRRLTVLFGVAQLAVSMAWAWGAPVHRAITYLALDGLPAEAPDWLRRPEVRDRAAFESNQADRWRGWDAAALKHENEPEHYLDAEGLEQFGLTLDTVPRLRMEYIRVMAVAKEAHPEKIAPYDPAGDPARSHEWPGFVLHAVAEHYAKLQAAFNQVRILEQVNEPARAWQLDEARAIAIYHVGQLSHFVGDISQPLHTTDHHNGWVGENPQKYKWRERFHAYIDDGWAWVHKIGYAELRPLIRFDAKVKAEDPWEGVLAYFKRSHALVEPLYVLERDGQLDEEEGKKLMTERMADAGSMLSALVWAAYISSEPTTKQMESWVKYDASERKPGRPASAPSAAPAPAP